MPPCSVFFKIQGASSPFLASLHEGADVHISLEGKEMVLLFIGFMQGRR